MRSYHFQVYLKSLILQLYEESETMILVLVMEAPQLI